MSQSVWQAPCSCRYGIYQQCHFLKLSGPSKLKTCIHTLGHFPIGWKYKNQVLFLTQLGTIRMWIIVASPLTRQTVLQYAWSEWVSAYKAMPLLKYGQLESCWDLNLPLNLPLKWYINHRAKVEIFRLFNCQYLTRGNISTSLNIWIQRQCACLQMHCHAGHVHARRRFCVTAHPQLPKSL